MQEDDTKSIVPTHVAIIMDGNGRWAQNKGLPRSKGHRKGLDTVKAIVKEASTLGIKYVTVYAFSTENWKRTQKEVGYLMKLIKVHLKAEFDFYKENKIRLLHIGNMAGLPEDVQQVIISSIKDTQHFTGTTVVIAINYGSKDEIFRAVKRLFEKGTAPSTQDDIQKALDIPFLPDVDLLIRTGGEKRLSNFLLWQCAYSEFIFCDTLWPDYTPEEFREHIKEFSKRQRRFGAVTQGNIKK